MAKTQHKKTDETGITPIVRANVGRHVVTSPSFVSLYANDTEVQTTPWDIRLTFGELSINNDSATPVVVKQTGEVRMSPQHAKRVAMILIAQLKVYEEKFGAIPQPSDD